MNYFDYTTTISAEDALEQISTGILEVELNDRKKLLKEDEQLAINLEKHRGVDVEVSFSPEDYNLIDEDDITLGCFDDEELVDEINKRDGGWRISRMRQNYMVEILENMNPQKFKDFICDVLKISHTSDKETILRELGEKIR